MKAIDIIDALTRVGSTEGTGLVETPANVDEMPDWLRTWFGEYVALDRELKPGTRYVYSYVDRLWTPRCEAREDCIMEVDEEPPTPAPPASPWFWASALPSRSSAALPLQRNKEVECHG